MLRLILLLCIFSSYVMCKCKDDDNDDGDEDNVWTCHASSSSRLCFLLRWCELLLLPLSNYFKSKNYSFTPIDMVKSINISWSLCQWGAKIYTTLDKFGNTSLRSVDDAYSARRKSRVHRTTLRVLANRVMHAANQLRSITSAKFDKNSEPCFTLALLQIISSSLLYLLFIKKLQFYLLILTCRSFSVFVVCYVVRTDVTSHSVYNSI